MWIIQFSCLVTLWMIQVPWYLATRYRFVACCHWEWYWFVAWWHFWWYRFVALWHLDDAGLLLFDIWTILVCCLVTFGRYKFVALWHLDDAGLLLVDIEDDTGYLPHVWLWMWVLFRMWLLHLILTSLVYLSSLPLRTDNTTASTPVRLPGQTSTSQSSGTHYVLQNKATVHL